MSNGDHFLIKRLREQEDPRLRWLAMQQRRDSAKRLDLFRGVDDDFDTWPETYPPHVVAVGHTDAWYQRKMEKEQLS